MTHKCDIKNSLQSSKGIIKENFEHQVEKCLGVCISRRRTYDETVSCHEPLSFTDVSFMSHRHNHTYLPQFWLTNLKTD